MAMTVAETLEGLAVRCEAATGPSGDLDWDIAWGLSDWINLGGWRKQHKVTGAIERFTYRTPPAYTASLDAAMSLEIEDDYYSMFALERDWRDDPRWTARLDSHGDECGNGDSIIVEAATRELAVTAVWLRLRAAKARAS